MGHGEGDVASLDSAHHEVEARHRRIGDLLLAGETLGGLLLLTNLERLSDRHGGNHVLVKVEALGGLGLLGEAALEHQIVKRTADLAPGQPPFFCSCLRYMGTRAACQSLATKVTS